MHSSDSDSVMLPTIPHVIRDSDFSIDDDHKSTEVRMAEVKQKEEDALKALLEARQPLKNEIRKLVVTHRDGEPPPFSNGELVVMAIIDGSSKSSSQTQIFRWILDRFPFYMKKVMNEMMDWFDGGYHVMFEKCAQCLHSDFMDVFTAYGVPITWCKGRGKISNGSGHGFYSVTIESAQRYLKRWIDLEPERKGIFRFLDLPAELRNRIYEMVLILPQATIKVNESFYSDQSIRMSVCEREVGSSPAKEASSDGDEYPCTIAKPGAVLNLAVACKQMAKEAIPIFYGNNKFILAARPGLITTFAKASTAERLRHLKKLHLDITMFSTVWVEWDDELRSALEELSDLIALDELSIRVFDRRRIEVWLTINKRGTFIWRAWRRHKRRGVLSRTRKKKRLSFTR